MVKRVEPPPPPGAPTLVTLSDEQAVSVERPVDGLVVRRDGFGVPYIEAETRELAAWGSGYAGTQDRMFLMDVLRHVGAARGVEEKELFQVNWLLAARR